MEWNNLEEGKVYAFGFLLIDVCESSEYNSVDFQRISEFLQGFVEKKVEKHGGRKWHWAGDGGTCGFLKECKPMVDAAIDILCELHPTRKNSNIEEFSVRICLHFGMAKWAKEPQNISGKEYSWICKNEKIIGVADAIISTGDVYGLIEDEKIKNKFKSHKVYQREEDGRKIETYIYDLLSTSNLVDIAKRYYTQKQHLYQIAPYYDLTTDQIDYLLKTAEIKNIVTKKIIIMAPRRELIENEIKEKFPHLREVKVIDYRGPYIKEEIGKAAAETVRQLNIPEGSSIAISCGTTIWELVKNLEIDPGNIKRLNVYPLVITMSAEMEEVSPAGIISVLTRVFPETRGYAVQFPKLELENIQRAKERKKVYSDECSFLIKSAKEANYMFTGLGRIGRIGGERSVTHSFNVLIEKLGIERILKDKLGAVGEFCYQPFTIDGGLLMDREELEPLRENLIYIDLRDLKEKVEEAQTDKTDSIHILAIAGGEEKHESILGGLRAKVFNNLITDIGTAEYIVKNA